MADKTYANLTVDTTLDNADLIAFYPVGGPLKVIAYQNLIAELGTDLSSTFLTVLNNLSDLNSAGVARTNLGLGTVATLNTGTTNGTVAVLGANGKAPIVTLPGGYLAKSSTYTVTAADNGKLIDCTGTFTLTIPDASVVGETFSFDVRNSGTGVITIAPAAGQVDGGATRTQDAGTTRHYVNNATNWFSTAQSVQGWTLLDTQNTTSGASVTFANISQGYSELLLEVDGVAITGALTTAFSSDGSSYSTAWQFTNVGAQTYAGQICIDKYTSVISAAQIIVGADLASPSTITPALGAGGDNIRGIKTASGVKHIRIATSSGSLGGGAIRLYAR